MKLIELKCPNCHAGIKVNEDLETAYCNYCGTQFQVEDENETKEERIIKAKAKVEEKAKKVDRDYYSSDEYEKKLDKESLYNDRTIFGVFARAEERKKKNLLDKEYQEAQKRETKETFKLIGKTYGVLGIICIGIFLIAAITNYTKKEDNITCYVGDKQYYLTFEKNGSIFCASCDEETLNELNSKYNDPDNLTNTENNIKSYYNNIGGNCGYKSTTSSNS